MHHHYGDITNRIAEPPKWWDEHGVPRYNDFAPREVSDIYAHSIVFMEIACQNCDTRFHVAMSQNQLHQLIHEFPPLLDDIDALHYGDPPNYGCCPAGPTMNSVPVRVIEAWKKEFLDWERVPELERDIKCDWMEGT